MVYHNTGTKKHPIPCFPFPGLNSYGRQDRRIDTGSQSPHRTAGALRKRSRGMEGIPRHSHQQTSGLTQEICGYMAVCQNLVPL